MSLEEPKNSRELGNTREANAGAASAKLIADAYTRRVDPAKERDGWVLEARVGVGEGGGPTSGHGHKGVPPGVTSPEGVHGGGCGRDWKSETPWCTTPLNSSKMDI